MALVIVFCGSFGLPSSIPSVAKMTNLSWNDMGISRMVGNAV